MNRILEFLTIDLIGDDMNNETRTEHLTRQNVLMLLSDDEVASVSTG